MYEYELETLLAVWQEDEAGKRTSLFPEGSVCVPPTVTVHFAPPTSRPLNFPLCHGVGPVDERGRTPVLCYPLPTDWQAPLSSTLVAYGGLINQGWKWQESSTGVFEAFLRLADIPDTATVKDVCDKVTTFARTWGPLWICRTPVHGQECYWRPDIAVFNWTSNNPRGIEPAWLRYQKKDPCQWIPREEVGLFLRKARQVKTLFEAIIRLQHDGTVSEQLWQRMEVPHASAHATASREEQLETLCAVLRVHLYWCSAFQVRLGWDNGPKLKIVPPPGFLHVVLFTLAQLLCQTRGAYQCDECGNFYIRTGKRPQAGKRNFCSECGTKASKRQWAQRKRHQANRDDQRRAAGLQDAPASGPEET